MSNITMNGSIASVSAIDHPPVINRPKYVNKAPDFQPIESNNWLIHTRYIRKEFDICKLIIQEDLEKSNGCNEFANYVLGLILRQEGKIQESLEYFQKCNMLNPLNPDNFKQIGCSLYLLGHHTLAADAYLRAERSSKNPDWNIHHNLGECYTSVGRLAKAREQLQLAVQLGRTEQSYEALAKLLVTENDINGAIDVYNAALELFPASSNLSTDLALLYMKVGETQKAFDNLGTALANDPSCSKALLAMAAIFQDNEEFDVALSKYKIAGQFLPESVALWNNMGMCFFGKGKYIAAISCLKRANYLNPLDWKSLYNLGMVHIHTKQYTSAFHYLSSAIKIRNRHATSFMLLACALKNLGDDENARRCLEQGIKLDPDDPALRVNYISYLCALGKKETAMEHMNVLQRIYQHQPNLDQEIVEAAKQLKALLIQDVAPPKQAATVPDEGEEMREFDHQEANDSVGSDEV